MMYADFELILEPIQGASKNPNVSSARGVNIHMPSGWCIHSKFAYENVTNPLAQYRGPDCVSKFCNTYNLRSQKTTRSFPRVPNGATNQITAQRIQTSY